MRRGGRVSELPEAGSPPSYFVQRHWTKRSHYDLYLELEGRLVSWMLPSAPSPDPRRRRFALRTPDRELDYGRFEGVLPPGEPGAGAIMVWDLGRFEAYPPAGFTADQALLRGLLRLHFHGEKLLGLWEMVRWQVPAGAPETWLLVKLRDRHAVSGGTLEEAAWSAITGRTVEQIVAEAAREPAAPARGRTIPAVA